MGFLGSVVAEERALAGGAAGALRVWLRASQSCTRVRPVASAWLFEREVSAAGRVSRRFAGPRSAVSAKLRDVVRGGGLAGALAGGWLRGARAFGPEVVPYVRVAGAGAKLLRVVARSCAAFMLRAKVNGGEDCGMRGMQGGVKVHCSIEP